MTNSQAGNDPNRLSLSSAKLFIDLLSNTNSRAGYVCFATSTTPTSPLYRIDTSKDVLKNGIDTAIYGGNTNTGLALKKACEFFEDSPSDNEKLVILLGDGDAQDKAQAEEAVEELKEKGVRIFTIGLGREIDKDKEFYEKSASETGAFFSEAQSANDLAGIFSSIYTNLVNGGHRGNVGRVVDNSIYVPIDGGASGVNVIFSSINNNPIEIIAVRDPGTGERFFPESLFKDSNYAILLLDEPNAGNWEFSVLGDDINAIRADLLTFYIVPQEINFIDDDKTIKTIEIRPGRTLDSADIADITSPLKEGADFAGWYSDESLTDLVDFSLPVWSDMNLYSKWTAKVYTVTFATYDDNLLTQEFAHGETIEFPKVSRGDYRLIGWHSGDANYTLVQDSVQALSGDMSFYAEWEYLAVDISLVLVLLALTAVVVLFSIAVFPRIIPISIIHNKWITSFFAVINNLLICLTVFVFFDSFASIRIFDQALVDDFFGIPFSAYFMIACVALPAAYNICAAYIAPYFTNDGYVKFFVGAIVLTVVVAAGSLVFTFDLVAIAVMAITSAAVYFLNFFVSALATSSNAYPNYRLGG
ncbi:MAG: VWA domain-containing protein [Oscillospiraceae bacterium]|nr:VWA domain-containing protein [Oscillospiraceae bacterium]